MGADTASSAVAGLGTSGIASSAGARVSATGFIGLTGTDVTFVGLRGAAFWAARAFGPERTSPV